MDTKIKFTNNKARLGLDERWRPWFYDNDSMTFSGIKLHFPR